MASKYEMFKNMQEQEIEQEGGRRNRKHKSASKKPAQGKRTPGKKASGKKGGIDLTPFLTSLLLLSSKMAYDKRSPSKALTSLFSSKSPAKPRRHRKPRGRVVGGYEDEEAVLENFAEEQKKNTNNVVSDVTDSVSGLFNSIMPKVGGYKQDHDEQQGGRKAKSAKKAPAKRAKSPVKKAPTKRAKSPAKRAHKY